MVKLSKDFKIVMPGDVYPTTLEEGATVEGDIAEKARAAGCVGQEKAVTKAKAMKAPENKAN